MSKKMMFYLAYAGIGYLVYKHFLSMTQASAVAQQLPSRTVAQSDADRVQASQYMQNVPNDFYI